MVENAIWQWHIARGWLTPRSSQSRDISVEDKRWHSRLQYHLKNQPWAKNWSKWLKIKENTMCRQRYMAKIWFTVETYRTLKYPMLPISASASKSAIHSGELFKCHAYRWKSWKWKRTPEFPTPTSFTLSHSYLVYTSGYLWQPPMTAIRNVFDLRWFSAILEILVGPAAGDILVMGNQSLRITNLTIVLK